MVGRSWTTRVISSPLGVGLRCEHYCLFALHVLGLGLLILHSCSWQLKEREAPLLSSCAPGRQVEQLLRCAELLVDGELFLHLDIADAVGKRGDDGLVRDLGDLEVGVVEALDVLLEGLSRLLPDAA